MEDTQQAKPAQQFQRKTILIKKGLQYRYMALIFMSVLLAFLVVGLDLVWTVSKVVRDHPMIQPILEDLFTMVPLFVIKVVVYMVIVLIMSAVVSHRMAGPIYKFEKSCDNVASGDLTHPVYLRKGDQLTDLQDHFNNMTEAVDQTVRLLEGFRAEAVKKDPSLKGPSDEVSKKIAEIMPDYKA
jgi:methyl-accepting chemotaxis protein